MPISSTHLSSPLLSLCWEKAGYPLQRLARVGLTMALTAMSPGAIAAVPELQVSAQRPITSPNHHDDAQELETGSHDSLTAVVSNQLLADEVYLYGQAKEAEQLGSEYLVFEVRDRQFTGAFYMPQSSFDCVYGEIEADQLVMTIVATYTQEQYSHTLALAGGAIASSTATVDAMQLEGFHKISAASANDHRIVNTCKAARPNPL